MKKMDALNANGKTKQVRKPSYTHEENTVLPEEVAANKVIIQSTLIQLGDQATKGPVVCVRTPDQVREKLSDMKKDFFTHREKRKKKEEKEREKKKRTRNKQKQTKWVSRPEQTV